MLNITTTLVHTDKGAPKIVAKGSGKQRTISYDHGVSHERNFGTAAGTLALALGVTEYREGTTHEIVTGAKHRFSIPI